MLLFSICCWITRASGASQYFSKNVFFLLNVLVIIWKVRAKRDKNFDNLTSLFHYIVVVFLLLNHKCERSEPEILELYHFSAFLLLNHNGEQSGPTFFEKFGLCILNILLITLLCHCFVIILLLNHKCKRSEAKKIYKMLFLFPVLLMKWEVRTKRGEIFDNMTLFCHFVLV